MGSLDKVPGIMREALEELDPIEAEEIARDYIEADPDGQADMLAFFVSNGPKKVADSVAFLCDGTPTSGELEGWLGPDDTL